MLGLPQTTVDQSMASEAMLAGDSPVGRLERIHCTIASRILERNQSDPSPNDVTLAQELDGELLKAAQDLPRKWWLSANLATTKDPEALFWDMRRLFHQLFHYNLLNKLHLPYMLRSNSTGDRDDYSRITCVNASREVLSRFMMFQSMDRIAFWCRTMHYLSLVAAMTLIIAHLDGHRREIENLNLLTHQRPGDRAMVEQAQESMEEMSRLNEDVLGAQSPEVLRQLLVIEAEAATMNARRAQPVSDPSIEEPAAVECQVENLGQGQSSAVRVRIPNLALSGSVETVASPRNGPRCRRVPHVLPTRSGNNRLRTLVPRAQDGLLNRPQHALLGIPVAVTA